MHFMNGYMHGSSMVLVVKLVGILYQASVDFQKVFQLQNGCLPLLTNHSITIFSDSLFPTGLRRQKIPDDAADGSPLFHLRGHLLYCLRAARGLSHLATEKVAQVRAKSPH